MIGTKYTMLFNFLYTPDLKNYNVFFAVNQLFPTLANQFRLTLSKDSFFIQISPLFCQFHQLHSWGYNGNGELSLGNFTSTNKPQQIVNEISRKQIPADDSNNNTNAQNNSAGIEASSVNNIKVYPNPVSSEITLAGLTRSTNYEIHTITGQLVQSGKTSQKINVENLQTGLYVLKLENVSVKFVKE